MAIFMAICPYCFNKINLNSLDFRCSNKNCLEPGTVNRHIIKRKLAKVDRHGYGTCDIEKCKRTTRTLICSHCKQDLPETIRDSKTKIISVVGAKGSGKSYYIATLLRQLMEEGLLSRVNGISTRFLPGSRDIYNNRYKKNLDDRIPLDGTNLVTDIVKDNPPVLVQMTYSKKKKIDHTYSFFDAAGESFNDPSILASITPYIAHSEAIIIILDPRQIDRVNNAVSAAFPNLPAVADEKYEDIINSVADVVYNALKLNPKSKISIPLCVAFSKWDLLINTPGLLPADFIVSQPSMTCAAGYDSAIIENSGNEIRALLDDWAPIFLRTVESKFKTVSYFGFSAWGMGSKDGRNIPAIASFRVEDPLLWIMNRNKLL